MSSQTPNAPHLEIDGGGRVKLKQLNLDVDQLGTKFFDGNSYSWTLNDERKQLEQASFARSSLLFSLFSAYCITLTLLFVTLPGVQNAGSLHPLLKLLLSFAFLVIFAVFGAILKRTNDKCRIVFQILSNLSEHPYSQIHIHYLDLGKGLRGPSRLLFWLTKNEPFWSQNFIAFFPAAFALLVCGVALCQFWRA